MKQSTRFYFMSAFIALILTISSYETAHGQPPPPPPGGSPGGGHNLNQNQGSGAPVGDGVWILIALAFSYGLNRYIRKKEVVPQEHDGDKHDANLSENGITQKQLQSSGISDRNNSNRKLRTGKIRHKRNSFQQFIRRPHFVFGHLQKNKVIA
jgi:hypothetical protein